MRIPILLTLLILFLSSCEKEEAAGYTPHDSNPLNPIDTLPTNNLQWDVIVDNSTPNNDIFIGNQYLGVQGWSHLATPPYIYVGAVFPSSSFARSFDKEIAGKKNPIDLSFNFPNPYLTRMEKGNGSEYLQKMKEAINSDEYTSYSSRKRPHIVRFLALKNLSEVENLFHKNPSFGKVLAKIGSQEFSLRKVKSICLGEIIFKGFTVSMDTPLHGIFVDEYKSTDSLVYIKSLTYGVSAYCVIISEYSYNDVLAALKQSFIESSSTPQGVLYNSQIISLITKDVNQESEIKGTFQDLDIFLHNPFQHGESYGYPIYCLGYYEKGNGIFVNNQQ